MTKNHQKPTPQLRDNVWSWSKLFYPHQEVLREIKKLDWVKKIVEYGAWTWADLVALHNLGYEVTYADFSPVAREKFELQLKEKWLSMNVDHSDVLDIQYDDNQFDLVYHCGLIEHFEMHDRKTIMEWTIRITKKYLIIDFPNTLSGHTIVKKIMMTLGKWPYGDETNFTYWEFKNWTLKNYPELEFVWFYGRELFPFPRKFKEGMWWPDVNISVLNYFKGALGLIFKKK